MTEPPETPGRPPQRVSAPSSRNRLIARGSVENPANRFERLAYAEDPEFVDDDLEDGGERRPAVRTRYYRDPSRTLLARNESPDIGFDVSLNPYRGCEHGCSYCVAPDTPVLGADLVWRPIGSLRVGDELVGFDEFPPAPGHARKLRRARVEAIWWSRKPTQRLITRGTEVVTTAEHRWLQARSFRWSRTEQLASGRRLRSMPVVAREEVDDDYRVGYVAGMTLGDGAKSVEGERSTRSYRRGFLAGFFDAEGHDGRSLRISQVYIDVLDRVVRYARTLGFELRLEHRERLASTVRLIGSVLDRIRWFSALEPAIARKRDAIFGVMPRLDPETIEAIEPGPVRDVVDIQTSTGTFYAAGLATHNCYARPTHEYLGLNAGLDFETHILVKEDAPALLEKALRSPRWEPETVAIGAVTDPYQPVERKARITRGCLEVFAKYRNPCAIITKSGLVTRDIDLLRELADHDAAVVNVSITSLDDRIRRAMEPRASSPQERLRAVEMLAKAGIPVGVMVAPIVPGLTDHEIPALVEAAARAGARTVRPIVLRLPYGVADLFEAWLARHFPERAGKVMSRIRALRGGRRNDPRFHTRLRGEGVFADQIGALFELACRRAGVNVDPPQLSTAAFRRPGGEQLALL